MPILALKSVKKWKEKTKTDEEETEKPAAIIARPPEPKHKLALLRDKVLSSSMQLTSLHFFIYDKSYPAHPKIPKRQSQKEGPWTLG